MSEAVGGTEAAGVVGRLVGGELDEGRLGLGIAPASEKGEGADGGLADGAGGVGG